MVFIFSRGDIISVIFFIPLFFLHPLLFSYSCSSDHSLTYLFSNCLQAYPSISSGCKSCFVTHSLEVDFKQNSDFWGDGGVGWELGEI